MSDVAVAQASTFLGEVGAIEAPIKPPMMAPEKPACIKLSCANHVCDVQLTPEYMPKNPEKKSTEPKPCTAALAPPRRSTSKPIGRRASPVGPKNAHREPTMAPRMAPSATLAGHGTTAPRDSMDVSQTVTRLHSSNIHAIFTERGSPVCVGDRACGGVRVWIDSESAWPKLLINHPPTGAGI